MMRRYTKADLEELVYSQLENLNAMHDLLSIMKHQNGLIENAIHIQVLCQKLESVKWGKKKKKSF